MAVAPIDVDAIASAVAALYQDVERSLIGQISRALRAGLDSPTQERQLAAVQALQTSARLTLLALRTDRTRAIREMIARAYRTGYGAALRDLPERLALNGGTVAQLAREASAEIAVPGSIESLANALIGDVGRVEANILRDVLDAYRAVQSGTAARILTGVQTRRQAAQAMWSSLVRKGIFGFTDKSGRMWRLSSYVEMAARTVTQRAAVQAQTDRLDSLGIRLVSVSNSPAECPKCRPFEGRVLALRGPTGRTSVVSPMIGRRVRVDVLCSLDEARARGLFHPQCTHSISAYLPGASHLPTDTENADGYKARQRQRAIERRIRGWKEQQAAALDEVGRQLAGKRLRAAQADMRAHLAAHPQLKRLRYREQIGAGNIPTAGAAHPDVVAPLAPAVQTDLLGGPGRVMLPGPIAARRDKRR